MQEGAVSEEEDARCRGRVALKPSKSTSRTVLPKENSRLPEREKAAIAASGVGGVDVLEGSRQSGGLL